jgi:hypothetical protein
MVTEPAQLRHLPASGAPKECAALTRPPEADRQTPVLHQTLIRLGQRIADLAAVAGLEARIAEIVEDMSPDLVAAEPGFGALSAAQVLLSWSHASRIRTEEPSPCSRHARVLVSSGHTRPAPPQTASATASSTAPAPDRAPSPRFAVAAVPTDHQYASRRRAGHVARSRSRSRCRRAMTSSSKPGR